MKLRTVLVFVLATSLTTALAACSSATDNVAGPTSLDQSTAAQDKALGVKPPPPLGSEETDIYISVGSGSPGLASTGGPAAADAGDLFSFVGKLSGRYFANTESTNGWIEFESTDDIVASPSARLQYDQKSMKTTGNGTLTMGDKVLYLDLIQITSGYFGSCGSASTDFGPCASVTFTYGQNSSGFLSVYPSFQGEE